MAVQNKWVDANVAAGDKGNPANIMPGKVFAFACTFEVAAADDDGSIYKLAKLGANLVPLQLKVNNDAITAGTDYDLGLYKEDGVVADKDLFADGADLSSAHAMGSELDGLTNLGIENVGKCLYELLGLTVATRTQDSYVLALTANTVGSAAGTISVRGLFIQG
jgi:hypothetical protein